GDGLTDIASPRQSPTGKIRLSVYVSIGHAFGGQNWLDSTVAWPDLASATWLKGDFNGDGKTDLVQAAETTPGTLSLDEYVSVGGGWFARQGTPTNWSGHWLDSCAGYPSVWWNCQAFLTGDFNGDGKFDILEAWDNQGYRQVDLFGDDSVAPDLLTSANNGL